MLPTRLLGLPGGGAAFIAAEGVGPQAARPVLALLCRRRLDLRAALLLLFRGVLRAGFCGLATLLLLWRWVLPRAFDRRGRRLVVAAIVAALGGLMQLLRGRLALGIAGRGIRDSVAGCRAASLLQLGEGRLALLVTIGRMLLG